MATAANTYSRAVKALKPNAARMAAIRAEQKEMSLKAKGIVVALLAKGHDIATIYQTARENRDMSEMHKAVSVEALGLLRKAARA
jgi:uncharacterized protein with GYD domain